MERYFMYYYYKTLRFIALHTNKSISNVLWKVWEHTSRGYCEGILVTGKMCKIPNGGEFIVTGELRF